MATEYALQKAGKANMTITLPEVNEFTVGELLYMLEVATGFAGELLNIDAFDQPGWRRAKTPHTPCSADRDMRKRKRSLTQSEKSEKVYNKINKSA